MICYLSKSIKARKRNVESKNIYKLQETKRSLRVLDSFLGMCFKQDKFVSREMEVSFKVDSTSFKAALKQNN